MSTEISIFDQGDNMQLPAHLQQYAKHAEDAAQMVTGFNSLPKISLKGKQFRYMKDDQEFVYKQGQPFNAVILATDPQVGVAKSWYAEAYNADTAELPDCFSADGLTPDQLSSKKQCRSCAECPKNAFGSGTDAAGNPSKGKACGDFKNLFVVEADKLDEQVSVLRVPATSLKNLSTYGRKLNKNKAAPQLLITQLTFTDSEFPQLEFNAIKFLGVTDAAKMIKRSESDEVQDALPSKNIIASFDPSTGEVIEAPLLSAPKGLEFSLEMTEKANGMTLEQFRESKWKDEDLIDQGYAVKVIANTEPELKIPAAPGIPAAPAKKEPEKTMTEKAGATTYDQFITNKWTDKTLIEHGYMELK